MMRDSIIVSPPPPKVAMEYMGGGCLTEILEQYEECQMTEGNIAWVCQEVAAFPQ